MAQVRRSGGWSYAPLELTFVVGIIAVLVTLVGLGSRTVADTATTTAKAGEVRAVEVADAGYRAAVGVDAPDVQTLVDAGYLRRAPDGLELRHGEVVRLDADPKPKPEPTTSTSTTLLPTLTVPTTPAVSPVTLP